jgi:hypothetical protein
VNSLSPYQQDEKEFHEWRAKDDFKKINNSNMKGGNTFDTLKTYEGTVTNKVNQTTCAQHNQAICSLAKTTIS